MQKRMEDKLAYEVREGEARVQIAVTVVIKGR